MAEEELATNPFFVSLKTHFPEIFKKLTGGENVLLCVPSRRSLGSASFNEHFMQSHILQTSPYFKEEYINENGQCVSIKGGYVSTTTGFREARKVEILGEEVFYSDDSNDGSYKVYLISGPLLGDVSKPVVPKLQEVLLKSQEKRSIVEWSQAVVLLLSRKKVMDRLILKTLAASLKKHTTQFLQSYTVIPGFLSAVGKRVAEIQRTVIRETRQANQTKLKEAQLEEISVGMECLISDMVHKKVYPAILKQHERDDKKTVQKFDQLITLSPEDWGCSLTEGDITKVDFTKAIAALKAINGPKKTWPMRKLDALAKTAEEIQAAVCSSMTLSADDMISCFAYCIVQARLERCNSNTYYLTTFHEFRQITSALDYLLVTFQGALSYIIKLKVPSTDQKKPRKPKQPRGSGLRFANTPIADKGLPRSASYTAGYSLGATSPPSGSSRKPKPANPFRSPASANPFRTPDRVIDAESNSSPSASGSSRQLLAHQRKKKPKKRDFGPTLRKLSNNSESRSGDRSPPAPNPFKDEEKKSPSDRVFGQASKSVGLRYLTPKPTPQVIDPGEVLRADERKRNPPEKEDNQDLISQMEALGPFGEMSGSFMKM